MKRLGVLLVLILASGCSGEVSGEAAKPTPSPTPSETSAFDNLPRGIEPNELDPVLAGEYEPGEMPAGVSCFYLDERNGISTREYRALGVLVDDPDLGEVYLDVAETRDRQRDMSTSAQERLAAFDYEIDLGRRVQRGCRPFL